MDRPLKPFQTGRARSIAGAAVVAIAGFATAALIGVAPAKTFTLQVGSNNTKATDQDGRCLRRYRRRWIVERTIGWLGNFRRLTVRYDRLLVTYGGFFHLACALLVLKRVLK